MCSAATVAERLFLELLGGGCQLPVGAYAESSGDNLDLDVFLATAEGDAIFRGTESGPKTKPEDLAHSAYLQLVDQADAKLINALAIPDV